MDRDPEDLEGSGEDELEVARDAPEADVLDQHRAADAAHDEDESPEIAPDVPEADALDQARAVPHDEEPEP